MYKITITVTNPMSPDSVTQNYQVDPDTFDESQWAAGFPIASDLIQQVKSLSSAKEPANWSDAATAITAKSLG
jgi:hypothetical protein